MQKLNPSIILRFGGKIISSSDIACENAYLSNFSNCKQFEKSRDTRLVQTLNPPIILRFGGKIISRSDNPYSNAFF